MLTEEHITKDQPTESEFREFEELAEKIKELNAGIDKLQSRLAYRLPITDVERAKMIRDEFELERLLVKAQYFMHRFG